MNDRLKTVTNALQNLESRIQTEVEQRVATAVADFLESDALRNIIDERVAEMIGASSPLSETSSSSDCSEPSCTSSSPVLDELEPECLPEPYQEEQEPSCSSSNNSVLVEPVAHYPNKWEFISVLNPGEVTNFRLEQFTKPVRDALNLPSDEDLFPRMSLEEMIERDHPTTSDSGLFDEKKITCKNRPHGKELTDEEFFCLAPCCSASRLYQAASCPFLPSFVRKRMVVEKCNVLVQRRADGLELITPIRWQIAKPIVPPNMQPSSSTVPEAPEGEEEEDEDPFTNRELVESREFSRSPALWWTRCFQWCTSTSSLHPQSPPTSSSLVRTSGKFANQMTCPPNCSDLSFDV